MKYLIPAVLSILLLSCSGKNDLPPGILKPQKMEEVFWDYIRADVYTNSYIRKDTNNDAAVENLKLQEKIFKLHHVTRDEFYKSLTYYSNHKQLMTTMMDSMIAKRKREEIKPAVKEANKKDSGILRSR